MFKMCCGDCGECWYVGNPRTCKCPEEKPKREWVGLTKEEINQNLLRSFYVLEKARAWRDGVEWAEAKLKEKNT